jgi:L-asparaginase II
MTTAPEMVSGEGRSDLALTRAGRGDWVCKVGAEAVQAIGIRSRGWGIAIKVADGGRRALLPATIAALEQQDGSMPPRARRWRSSRRPRCGTTGSSR